MDYLAIAYTLIAVVLISYAISVWRRRDAIRRERILLESKND
jgi:hypothetical protein